MGAPSIFPFSGSVLGDWGSASWAFGYNISSPAYGLNFAFLDSATFWDRTVWLLYWDSPCFHFAP